MTLVAAILAVAAICALCGYGIGYNQGMARGLGRRPPS